MCRRLPVEIFPEAAVINMESEASRSSDPPGSLAYVKDKLGPQSGAWAKGSAAVKKAKPAVKPASPASNPVTTNRPKGNPCTVSDFLSSFPSIRLRTICFLQRESKWKYLWCLYPRSCANYAYAATPGYQYILYLGIWIVRAFVCHPCVDPVAGIVARHLSHWKRFRL